MPLTDRKIKVLRPSAKATKYSDGGGLHLLITPQGSKLWRQAYRFGGKQKTLALGSYPLTSLSEARHKSDEAKKCLTEGIDPAQQAKLDRINRQALAANTFDVLADEFLLKVEREGKAGVTLTKKRWLLSLARPDFGHRPIREITAAEVLVSLRRVEAKGNYETARRMRAAIGQVFRYAIATAKAENDPTFGLKGALTAPVVTHRAAIIEKKAFGGLLRAVWDYNGAAETCAALQLMALLYPRPGELRQSEWTEFDLDKAVWTIPAVRMKMRRQHRKPLPPKAMSILKEVRELTGGGKFVFPAIHTRARPMSENTLNGALRRLGFSGGEATAHGFRASASSILNESGNWSPDAIEAELAHLGADEVRRAYHRAQYWDERVKMAVWWEQEIERMRQASS